jgi:hypothetical protein
MSKPSNYGPSYDRKDATGDMLDTVSRLVFYAGLIATIASFAFLAFYFVHFSTQQNNGGLSDANSDLFAKVLIAGVIAAGVSSCYLYWGEEALIATQIIVALVLLFAPMYLPMVVGTQGLLDNRSIYAAQQIQKGGIFLGGIAVLALIAEVILRIRVRMLQGSKSDQLKFGKGIVEERRQNQFMGKCWQLPFCRKFVRERCPIYHARRTCWKERVGCMCEEEVISNAMQNKAIPKDIVAAARYIPVNNKLSAGQKKLRCRQCVIYNEHLKHKYRLALPATVAAFGLLYVIFRGPMLDFSQQAILSINKWSLSNTGGAVQIQTSGVMIFREVLVDSVMFVLLAYVLKLLEYFFFKLKV